MMKYNYIDMKKFFGSRCHRISKNMGMVSIGTDSIVDIPRVGEYFRIGKYILRCADSTDTFIVGTFTCNTYISAQTRRMVSTISSILILISIFMIIGYTGGYEQDLITGRQYMIRSLILIAIFAVSAFINNKIGGYHE